MQVYGRTEKMRIPANRFARKGDGIGCRVHVECRHSAPKSHDPFWVICRMKARRAARALKAR